LRAQKKGGKCMETFAADGGVQPHSGSGKPADWTSTAHDQFPVDESSDADKIRSGPASKHVDRGAILTEKQV